LWTILCSVVITCAWTAGIAIRRVCWFVSVERDLSNNKICHGCSTSAPNVTVNFSEVKVKVEGQTAVLNILFIFNLNGSAVL